jgi:hypothetical protein
MQALKAGSWRRGWVQGESSKDQMPYWSMLLRLMSFLGKATCMWVAVVLFLILIAVKSTWTYYSIDLGLSD